MTTLTRLSSFSRRNRQGYRALILSHNPVAYWRLGETSGIVAADEMGSFGSTYTPNSAGAWTGGMLGQAGAVANDTNKAALFNGTSGQASAGAVLAQTGEFSVEAWAKPSSFGSSPMICSRVENSGAFRQNWLLFIRTPANKWAWQVRDSGTDNEVQGSAVTLGVWTHVVGTYAPTGVSNPILKIYVNGALAGTDATGANASSAATLITTIGSFAGTSNYWVGGIDEVAIYNRALTATEILQHYNKGISG